MAPRVVYFYFEGHTDLAMFEPSMVVINDVLRAGQAELYGDGEGWKSYASGYRDAWTQWFLRNRQHLAHTHLVIRSPLLRMGVQVVNLVASSPIEALDQSAELYRRLRARVPRARELTHDWPADIASRLRGP
ncbi:MAG: hypothetical protein EOO75_00720 [Myxococcales bacterium]|nr:MAG: hypothetical protein EOO75_00720 [Myxococcales bacterium]